MDTLTTSPAVYHDDYTILSLGASFAERFEQGILVHEIPQALQSTLQSESGTLTPGLGVGYHLTMGIWFKLSGIGIVQARLFSVICGLIMLLATFWLGRQWGNLYIGLTAAVLLCLDGTFWYATRTVRPEPFTVAVYLLAACLASTKYIGLSSLLVGLGLTGHPIGFVLAPTVLLLFLTKHWSEMSWRRFIRFAGPAFFIALAYLGYLFYHWEDVQQNLQVHQAQRSLESWSLWKAIPEEWRRYSGSFLNTYMLEWGLLLRQLSFYLVGCAILIGGILLVRTRQPQARKALIFPLCLLMSMILLAILGRDNNFLYLVNILPLLYLAALIPLSKFVDKLIAQSSNQRKYLSYALALIPVIVISGFGKEYYREVAKVERRAQIIPFQQLESLLAEQIPEGSVVIGIESAWLTARKSNSHFLFNRLLEQWQAPSQEYPVTAKHEGSHVIDYQINLETCRKLEQQGHTVFFVTDTWDWGWNYFAPFGKYANAYVNLQRQLDAHFTPMVKIWSRDRYFTTLYRFGKVSKSSISPMMYIEGQRMQIGQLMTPLTSKESTTTFDLKAGQQYLLRFEASVTHGKSFSVHWNGMNQLKYVDANIPLMYEYILTAKADENVLRFIPADKETKYQVKQIQLIELTQE